MQTTQTARTPQQITLRPGRIRSHRKTAAGMEAATATYEVTIENLTPMTGEGSSQPFSPAILATHRGRLDVLERQGFATDELAMVAEDAISGPLVEKLSMSRFVSDVSQGDGVTFPGAESRFEISASVDAKKLSIVFMLVNTNDAFGWLDSAKLPKSGEAVYMVGAYDAGTEANTEAISDIPGPCCGNPGMGEDEHMKIRHHDGILGIGDLDSETWGWSGPVARVTITRVH